MSEKLQTLIIEDEELARNLLHSYLKDHPDIEIIGECENGFDGVKAINDKKPDLVFLDIQMPKITGFELNCSIINPRLFSPPPTTNMP
jgi:two-component system LytT family response regulator